MQIKRQSWVVKWFDSVALLCLPITNSPATVTNNQVGTCTHIPPSSACTVYYVHCASILIIQRLLILLKKCTVFLKITPVWSERWNIWCSNLLLINTKNRNDRYLHGTHIRTKIKNHNGIYMVVCKCHTKLGQSSDKEGGTFFLRILLRIGWVLHRVLHRTNIRTKLSNGAVSPLKNNNTVQ